MPEINIPDFDKVELYPPMLDPGVYTLTVKDPPEVKAARSSGKPILTIVFEVVNGPAQKQSNTTGDNSPVGRKITDGISLEMKSKIKQLYIAAGLLRRDDKTSPAAKGNLGNTDRLVGCTVQAVVAASTYEKNGENRETRKIDKYLV